MAELEGSWFEGMSNTARKKRTLRQRSTEAQFREKSLSPMASPFDEINELNCDDNGGLARKGVGKLKSRNHGRPRESETDEIGISVNGNRQSVPGHSNSKGHMNCFLFQSMKVDSDAQLINGHFGMENANKPKRIKLKVDGVMHNIQGNAAPKDKSNGYCATVDPAPKGCSYQKGTSWKDFPRGDLSAVRDNCYMGSDKSKHSKQVEKSEPVRKSERTPNRRVLDPTLEYDEGDDEIRFLEKLRNPRSSIGLNEDEDDGESSRKHQKYSRVSEMSMAGYCSEVSANMENEDQDAKLKSKERDTAAYLNRNTVLTARQRALQMGRGMPSSPDANLEFPNGLQAAPSIKKKDTLSEKELLKKAEVAQKRRLQNEKAAQKSQEDAIRKILNQDSSKKKKEDQRRKRLNELAEEKAAYAVKHQAYTVRVVMSPTGTIVSFGEKCIPSIFTAKTSSYPPPRESCAGPSCTNPYKYRDSKSNLPLCSLECYKAIQKILDKESYCQDYISNSSS